MIDSLTKDDREGDFLSCDNTEDYNEMLRLYENNENLHYLQV